MYYHNANVVPFPTIWETNARLKQKPKIDLKLIDKVRKLSQEGIAVLQDLHPNANWRSEQWDVETIPVRFLFQQLKSGIGRLENMDTTHDTDTLEWIYSIRDRASEASVVIQEFELNLDQVLDNTLGQRERRKASEEIEQNKLVLIEYIDNLINVLK
jgi:hypothetical protein